MSETLQRKARSRVLLATIVAVLASVFADSSAAQAVGGPCEAPRYKALLQVDFGTMSDDDYRYFLTLDQACRMHKRELAATITGSPDEFNPCIHPPYAVVAAVATAVMTEREYVYYREVDRECTAYHLANGIPDQEDPPPARSMLGQRLFASVAVLGSIVAMLFASVD